LSEKKEEKPSILEKFARNVMEQAAGRIFESVSKSAERFVKGAVRTVALAFAGVVIAVLGVTFVAVGVVRWFSQFTPAWLSWLYVGIVLLLLGIVVTLLTFVRSKS